LRATLIVEDQTAADRNRPIVIQVDWTEDEDGEFEKGIPRFFKLKENQLLPKQHLDVNLIELAE
jgi:hypothetical protein